MKKKKILQVGALSINHGGLETYIINQWRHINKNNFKYDFLVMRDDHLLAYEDEVVKLGGEIHRNIYPKKEGIINAYIKLYKFLKENQYDIIVCNVLTLRNIDCLILGKILGTPLRIAHSHQAFETGQSIITRMLSFINCKILPYVANRLFACSEEAGVCVFKNAWKKIPSNIVLNSIELDKFIFSEEKRETLRKALSLEYNIVIGHTGSFATQKNHEFLIDIFSAVVKKNKRATLLLIGNGPLLNKIKSKVNKLGLTDKVIFLGEKDDVSDYLQIMDVFVFPSLCEGFGISLLEAQASGLPVFTSKDVVPEIVRVTELLEFMPLEASPNVWAEKILNVVSNKYDRKKYNDVVREAGYDSKDSIKMIESIYSNGNI